MIDKTEVSDKEHYANLFHVVKQSIDNNKKKSLDTYLSDGEALAALHDAGKDVWKAYDQSLTSWKSVCASLGLSPSNTLNQIAHTRRFGAIIKQDNLCISQSALRLISPLILSEEQAKEILHSAATMPHSEFKTLVSELKGEKTVTNCNHDNKESWTKCIGCGTWEKV